MKRRTPPKAEIVPIPSVSSELSTDLSEEAAQVRTFIAKSVAENTKAAYAHDWATFTRWCESKKLSFLPAAKETVASYAAALASGTVPYRNGAPKKRKLSSIARAMSTIGRAHILNGEPSPTRTLLVKETMKGIARDLGRNQTRKKPVTSELLPGLLSHLKGANTIRDTAIILLGWAMAGRRSEIASLDIEDIDIRKEGLVALLRRSKTDQEGRGKYFTIPRANNPNLCPVAAVEALLREMSSDGLTSGPLFISDRSRQPDKRIGHKVVANIIKRVVNAEGLDESEFSGHSLRAGFVTSAARAGKGLHEIQKRTGHKSLDTLALYLRSETLWEHDVGKDLL